MGSLNLSVDGDELVKLQNNLKLGPEVVKKAAVSGLSSASFFLQQRLKNAVKINEFGWTALSNVPEKNRSVGAQIIANPPIKKNGGSMKIKLGKKTNFWGSFVNTIRYTVNKEKLASGIGVLGFSQKKGEIARDLQILHIVNRSIENPQTMAKYFRAIGIPLRNGKSPLQSPQRELFGNVMDKYMTPVNVLLATVISNKLTSGFQKNDGTPFDELTLLGAV